MKKSVSKRIKITGSGKFIRRSMALDHFRTRKSTKNLRRKRKYIRANHQKKAILRYV